MAVAHKAVDINPLENSMVIGRICDFLPSADLLNCRRVNRQWNSECIYYLRRKCNVVNLRRGIERITAYVNFLSHRSKDVEWYEGNVQYKFSFWSGSKTLNQECELVQELIDQFGSCCVREIAVNMTDILNQEWDESMVTIDEVSGTRTITQNNCQFGDPKIEDHQLLCLWLEEIIREISLDKLQINFDETDRQGSVTQCSLMNRVLKSPTSIRKLVLDQMQMQYSGMLAQMVLEILESAPKLLAKIEELELTINSGESCNYLQKLQLPALERVQLTLDYGPFNFHKCPTWSSGLRDFLNNCKGLTECTLMLVGKSGDREFEQLLGQELDENIPHEFPSIIFHVINSIEPYMVKCD